MSSPTTIVDLGGTIVPFLRNPNPLEPEWSAFNPSIAKDDSGNYKVLVRSSNYYLKEPTGATRILTGNKISSRIWIGDVLPNSLDVLNLRQVVVEYGNKLNVRRGAEDARLFYRPDGWYFTAVLLEYPDVLVARLGLFKLDPDKAVAHFIRILPGPMERRPEKNWMAPDVESDNFDFIYSPSFVYKNDELFSIQTPKGLPELRGSSGLIRQSDGTYLAVTHTVDISISRKWVASKFCYEEFHERVYQHYFTLYAESGSVIKNSSPFIFKNIGVEFCSGLVEHGDELILSWGAKDVFAVFSKISKENVIKFLEKY